MTAREVVNKNRTERQIARVLGVLKGDRLTAKQIAAKLHMSIACTSTYIRMLRDEPRQIRACDYLRSGGRASCVFELGADPDAVFTRARKPVPPSRGEVQRKRMLKELAQPKSVQMLVARLNLTDSRVRFYLRELRDEGKVFLIHWQRTCANPTPFYARGAGPDAPQPTRLSIAEYKQRARQRKTAWAAALGV